jgi:lysophospholipase L1-like esterase
MSSNLNPKVFWIVVGTNDLGEDHCAVESIVAGILAVVGEVQLQRPDATIVVNSLLPRSIHPDGTLGSEFWPSIQSINRMLESFIGTLEGVHWFHATNLFLSNDTTMNTQLMPDLLHPSASGSRIWCRKMLVTLERLMND